MSRRPHGKTERDPDVHSITDARVPHTDEMRTRMIKYSVSMGIRVVCLILVFFTSGWLQWAFIAGAVLLPYFAVIIANGGSDTSKLQHSDSLLEAPPARELEAGSTDAAGDASSSSDRDSGEDTDGVVEGEVVDDDVPPAPEEEEAEEAAPEPPWIEPEHTEQHDGQEHRHTL
ncbi:DUF3099 domain-containing protein [Arthrobacter sp. H14]|uniref:DUF3099 domain-containing protein n=1 Tax=Arthrobacter sp. H14 TaxID=1312959 RepID=UPI0009E0A221|nr:DUF3099 domain-containing protein [Arthrobacter sp. H14]